MFFSFFYPYEHFENMSFFFFKRTCHIIFFCYFVYLIIIMNIKNLRLLIVI